MTRWDAEALLGIDTKHVVGSQLVSCSVDRVIEDNEYGERVIYDGSGSHVVRRPTSKDPAYQLSKVSWMAEIRRKFDEGTYGYTPTRFGEDVAILHDRCYGPLPAVEYAWIEWARDNITLLHPVSGKPIETYKRAV